MIFTITSLCPYCGMKRDCVFEAEPVMGDRHGNKRITCLNKETCGGEYEIEWTLSVVAKYTVLRIDGESDRIKQKQAARGGDQ